MDKKRRCSAPGLCVGFYAEGDDPGEVAQRYIQSPEATDDARGFDVADILGDESTILVPSASSPLK